MKKHSRRQRAQRGAQRGAQESRPLAEGKVPWERIAAMLPLVDELPADVLLGPGHGEDAALVRTAGGELWAVASDPITFASADAGQLVVLVNANDVAVRGATPRFFTASVLLAPGEQSGDELERVFGQMRQACDVVGAWLVGGHTEVTPGLPRTVIAGTMLGPVRGRPISTAGLRPGDRVGLTKWAGLEGTAILLAEHGERLRELPQLRDLRSPEELADLARWLSVVPEATIAAGIPSVSALHDVTEGGVAEALFELASASGCAIEIDLDHVPLLDQTRAVCAALALDPLGLIGSGAMLVGCALEGAATLAGNLTAAGVPLTWIGEARPAAPDAAPVICCDGTPLRRFVRDELVKLRLLDGIQAVVFDLDGTLVDSPYDWEGLRARLGVQGDSIIDELERLPSPERAEKWALLEAAEQEATARARPCHGAVEVLALLRRRGLRTALVTNNSQRNAEVLLERAGLAGAFDEVLSRDVGLWKPSGAPVAEALQRLGVNPARCLAVGDSRQDVLAATAAGCRRIAVVNRPRASWIHEEQVDLVFAHLTTLSSYLHVCLS